MRVAALQVGSSADAAENRRRVRERLHHAALSGIELAVLPEAMAMNFPVSGCHPYGESLDGAFVTSLVQGAAEEGIVVVAGMFERIEGSTRCANTVVVVDGDGLRASYRKVHLFDALGKKESEQFVAGDPGVLGALVGIGAFSIGVMTCYDLRFPESARALVDSGADVVCVPAHWYAGAGKIETWEVLLRARAIENTAYVVAACKPGPECVGSSMILDPMGVVLARAGSEEEGEVVAELSLERLVEVRRSLPVLEHRRFSVTPRSGGAV